MIRHNIIIQGINKTKKLNALFDSGANYNYIKRKFSDGDDVNNIGFHVFEGQCKARLATESTVDGQRVRFKQIKIDKCQEEEPLFVIIDSLSEDVIIGAYQMQKFGIVLDLTNERIL